MSGTPSLSESAWQRRESAVRRFEDAWRTEVTPVLEEFLPPGEPARSDALLELVITDMEYRWQRNAPEAIESYLGRFPELAGNDDAVADLILIELQLRQRVDPAATIADYVRRFPHLAKKLSELAAASDAGSSHTQQGWRGTGLATGSAAGPMRGVLPNYEFLEELGRGGMGVVWKARQLGLDRFVAIKMILSGSQASQEEMQRFQAEAQALARIRHPNIVQVYEVGSWLPAGSSERLPFIAMEYVDGQRLDRICAGMPMSPLESAELVQVLAEAIHGAHELGIVHRDLKPANVLISVPGSASSSTSSSDARASPGLSLADCVPKITDFGLAKRLEDDGAQTHSGALIGTPSYMAPEQARGQSRTVTPAADVYALGAILYELLTGRPPFRGTTIWETVDQVIHTEPVTPRALQPRVPRDLETICLKCLQKSPGRRYETAASLAADLARFLRREPIHARPTGPVERLFLWTRRNPLVASLAAALLAAIAVGFAVVSYLYLQAAANYAAAARARDDKAQALRDLVEQQAETRNALQRARSALERISDRVVEESFSRHPRLTEADKQYLRQFLADYEELAQQADDSTAARHLRAEGHARIGRLRQRLGDVGEARAAYEVAHKLDDELLGENRHDRTARRRRAEVASGQGQLEERTGNPRGAFPHYNSALEDYRQLAEEDPNDAAARRGLAQTLLNLGMLHRALGQLNESRRELNAASRELDHLTTRQEADHLVQRMRADAHNALGVVARQAGDYLAAEKAFQASIGMNEILVRQEPSNPGHRRRLAMVFGNLGNLQLINLRQANQAESAYRSAIKLQTPLAAEFPGISEYQQELAGSLNALANVQRATRQLARSSETLNEALEIQARLVSQYPDIPAFEHELALTRANLGGVMLGMHRLAEAKSLLLLAAANYDRLIKADPEFPQYRFELASCLNNLGHALLQSADLVEAETAHRRALAMRLRLLAGAPDVVSYRDETTKSLESLEEVLRLLGKAEAAGECRNQLERLRNKSSKP